MHRRLLTPILSLLLLLTALPGSLMAQTSPTPADASWAIADLQTLESGEDEYIALSPDGTQIAGIGADGGLCVWQVETMASSCAERVGGIRGESITWSPDGTAVAFSFDHVVRLAESDIFVYEVAEGSLHNLTDDGHEGSLGNPEPGTLVDGVPAWSPDSSELVFARSQPADDGFGTAIMRIDRAGGQPSPVYRLPLGTPYGIFMPMHWLPDDTILYTQVSLDGTDPADGVYRVGLDGSDARRLLPGARGTETAGPLLMDVAPESGHALIQAAFVEQEAQFEVPEEPLVWLLDIESGEATAVPNLPTPDGMDAVMAGRARYAAFSPDESAVMGIYTSAAEGTVLAVSDRTTGEVTVIASDIPARPGYALPTWGGDRLLLPEINQATLVTLAAPAGAAASPVASPAASSTATGGGAWRIAEHRELDLGTRAPTLSPDGRWLAGQGPDGTFCVWDAETAAPTCAGENLPIRAETVAWSPDGTAVAFALDAIRLAYESDIYVYELATGELTNLTDDGAEGGLMDNRDIDPPGDDVPVWSPDSREIAFVRSLWGGDEPGTTAIMRIDRAGGEPTEVLRIEDAGPFAVWMPMSWLPDGTLVYAQSSNELSDPRNGIWTVGIDGGEPVQVAPGATESEIPGAMVVDVDAERGQAIVMAWMLANQRGVGADQPLYWLVDLSSGEREPFPAMPAKGDSAPGVIDAGYSPDGETLLLAMVSDEGFTLATMDPDTLAVAPVEGGPIEGAAPVPVSTLEWASNGTVALHAPQGAVIVTLDPPAGQTASPAASPVASPVASGAGWRIADERALSVESRYVAMSPDGTQLAGLNGDGSFCLWVTETLVSTCIEERLPIRAETIAWSPDGTAVAFALDAIRQLYESDIYVYEVVSGELRNLTDDGVEGSVMDALDANAPLDDVPAWSPDGQRIAFARSYWGVDDEDGSTAIMVIDRAGGEPVELLPLDVEEPLAIWSPMYWLPDGTLLYSQIARDVDDPRSGVWSIGIDDGASPLQAVPGDQAADVPGPSISDAAGDRAIVYSYWLMAQFAFDADQPLFWMVDVETGDRTPVAIPDGDAWILDAGFSPDGETVLLVTRSPEGSRLMLLDVASGEIAPLDPAPRDMTFAAGSPQWATNDTVLLQTPTGPVLLTLEPAG